MFSCLKDRSNSKTASSTRLKGYSLAVRLETEKYVCQYIIKNEVVLVRKIWKAAMIPYR